MEPLLFNSRQNKQFSMFFEEELPTVYFQGQAFIFHCGEGLYQALKAPLSISRLRYYERKNGQQAKAAGRAGAVSIDWDQRKINAMRYVVSVIYSKPTRRLHLMDSLGFRLVHYSPWDTFWGVDQNLEGENNLGKLLMLERYMRSWPNFKLEANEEVLCM